MPALFPAPGGPSPKINVTSGVLPHYNPSNQAPTKKSPWGTIRDAELAHTATAILPEELYDILWRDIEALTSSLEYAKVIMKLEDVLQGAFFNQYIKQGSILMISEGEPGVDEVFSLTEGVLSLDLSKEVYERAGLQGTPVSSGGRKHVKSRYRVEINLRLPSMLHSKKGFERLVWAAKTVLNRSVNWIFLDLDQSKGSNPSKLPITAYHPTMQPLLPTTHLSSNVRFPSTLTTVLPFSPNRLPTEETQETIFDLLEYLDMLALASSQVEVSDQTDPFISRYKTPDFSVSNDVDTSGQTSSNIKVLTWAGLISSQWILEILFTLIKRSRTDNLQHLQTQSQWLAFSVSAHKTQATGQTEGYTVLLQPEQGADEQSHGEDGINSADHLAAEADRGATSENVPRTGVDVDMTEPQAEEQSQPQKKAYRVGFHRYLCAEYIDSLS